MRGLLKAFDADHFALAHPGRTCESPTMNERVHDIWGISNHTFSMWFVVAATSVMVAAMGYRAIAFRGRRVPSDDIDAQHAAFLSGGPTLAVYSALGELRGAGAIGVESGRVLTRIAPLPVNSAMGLNAAVYEATAERLTAAGLSGHPTVTASLGRIRDDLEQAGLLLEPSQLPRARWFVYGELAVVVVGVARAAACLVNGTSVGDLLSAFVLVGLFLIVHDGEADAHTRRRHRAR